jgi:hypothetical protein
MAANFSVEENPGQIINLKISGLVGGSEKRIAGIFSANWRCF